MNGFVFDKGIDITPVQSPMGFTYGAGVFGPEVEIRRLEDIRASLRAVSYTHLTLPTILRV